VVNQTETRPGPENEGGSLSIFNFALPRACYGSTFQAAWQERMALWRIQMSAIQRERLFSLYAQNLETLKLRGAFSTVPDITDFFLCPLCLRLFLRSELDEQDLSLDHVPPQSVGGTKCTLTCTSCNNEAGKTLDSALKRKLAIEDFQAGILGARLDVRFSPGEDIWLPAKAHRHQPGGLILEDFLNPKRSHPDDRQHAQELLATGVPDVQIQHLQPGWRRIDVALLRIAYLYAFSVLGYGLILNPIIQKVREQVNKPEKHILPGRWMLPVKSPPPSTISLNVVRMPEYLQSFLVIFELVSPNRMRRPFAVILPFPGASGLEIYSRFEEAMRIGNLKSLLLAHVPEATEYLIDPTSCFIAGEGL